MTKKIFLLKALGLLFGAVAGYIYYTEIGCLNGTCPITSKPLNSMPYGALMGALLFNIFVKPSK